MSYSKINPKVSFVKQEGPFTVPVTVESDYLTTQASHYVPVTL